jgi:putative methyltransferase (TIGR04325 family)
MNLRTLARLLLPPLVTRSLKRHLRLPGDIVFSGDYPDWATASARCKGYDDEAILASVIEATRAVVRGEALYERDSQLSDRIEYSWPLLASLLRVASESKPLRVIDFGGSLGSSLRQNHRYLSGLSLQWKIVEQSRFVDAGRREFTTDTLSFFETISEAAATGVDVVIAAGVLNHIENPDDVLRQILECGAPYLIIDRTMVVDEPRDVIAIQRVPARIYEATYPVRKFGHADFIQRRLSGWRTVEEWTCDLQPDPNSRSIGLFCERTRSPATDR